MTLGERIIMLRTEKELSQEKLAEQLGVSRQAISKWETDASVPELDKLLRMSELFGVTLDALVKGAYGTVQEDGTASAVAQATTGETEEEENGFSLRVLLGTISLCFGVLTMLLLTLFSGSLLEATLISGPFLVAGIVALVVKRRTLLWCLWAVSGVLIGSLYWSTGVRFSAVLMLFVFGLTGGLLVGDYLKGKLRAAMSAAQDMRTAWKERKSDGQ